MLHDTQAAPETTAIQDRRLGRAEDHDDDGADAEQVFTTDATSPAGLTPTVQRLNLGKLLRPAVPSSYDEYDRPRRRTRSKKGRGGWGHTTELSAQEVRYLHEGSYRARSAGTPWNFRVDIRAPNGLSLAEGKRWLQTKIARVGQSLERHGFDHFGATVFERKPHDDFMHCHHALHVSVAALPIIKRLCDGDAVRLQRWHHNLIGYMTKQRQQLPPDYERRLPPGLLWKRQPGDIIPGRRLSFTKAMMAMMPAPMPPRRRRPDNAYVAARGSVSGTRPVAPAPAAEFCEALNNLTGQANQKEANQANPQPEQFTAKPAPESAEYPDTIKAGETPPRASRDHYAPAREAAQQLALPLAAPVIDFAAMAEAKRKDLGLSQREAARMLGIRQPHWSNSINRRHDTLSPWTRNRLREWVSEGVAA